MNKTFKFLLFGILMVLLGIYSLIFMVYSESYFFCALAVIFPVIGFVVGLIGMTNQKRENSKMLALQEIPKYKQVEKRDIIRIDIIWKEDKKLSSKFSTEDKETISCIMDKFSECNTFIAESEAGFENGLVLLYDVKGEKTVIPFSGVKFGCQYYQFSDTIKDYLHSLDKNSGS